MPEDRPNSSRDAASVIDAVRAIVLTKPAGNPKAAARSAGGSARRFVEDGGAGAVRGPWTAARNASSWPLSAAARSASFSAATARRRFFSFFRSFFRRFRFFSSLRSRFRFFSFLRFRLRLRSSLLLELLLELDDELDDDDAICAHRFASRARGTAAHCGTPRCDRCAPMRPAAACALLLLL